MSIVAEKPIESNVDADAWKAHSAELAVWMFLHLVNRTDCYGINKPDGNRATGHGKLTVYRLKGHVEARALIGSHLISTDDTCRYIAYDVDAHTDSDNYQQNLNTVLDLAARAGTWGWGPFSPIPTGREVSIFGSSSQGPSHPQMPTTSRGGLLVAASLARRITGQTRRVESSSTRSDQPTSQHPGRTTAAIGSGFPVVTTSGKTTGPASIPSRGRNTG